jgi:solute carrier family 35 protein E4
MTWTDAVKYDHNGGAQGALGGAVKKGNVHLASLEALHQKSAGTSKAAETAIVVILWFFCNISLANFTKWLYVYGEICLDGQDSSCTMYKFPLAITVVHMVFSWCFCHIQIHYVRKQPKGSLSVEQQVRKVAPLASCFALSVAMGNLSLKYIFPSFNQMLGSMSPLITVLIATVLPPRKRYNSWTWLSMPVICGGLIACTVKEVHFNALGAFYAMGATVLRAVKSIMQGKLLDPSERLDSVTLLYYMAPFAAALLLIFSLLSEGLEPYVLLMPKLRVSPIEGPPTHGTGTVVLLLALSGVTAWALNIMNFLVTAYTGPVTLQVLGNVKSCASIAVSVAIFGNPLLGSQIAGVGTCLLGVWIYTNRGGVVKPPALPEKGVELMPSSSTEAPASSAASA